MAKTIISLTDNVLLYETLDSQAFNCPISLDTLTQIVDISDPARVILFARHGLQMPANIIGAIRCGTCSL